MSDDPRPNESPKGAPSNADLIGRFDAKKSSSEQIPEKEALESCVVEIIVKLKRERPGLDLSRLTPEELLGEFERSKIQWGATERMAIEKVEALMNTTAYKMAKLDPLKTMMKKIREKFLPRVEEGLKTPAVAKTENQKGAEQGRPPEKEAVSGTVPSSAAALAEARAKVEQERLRKQVGIPEKKGFEALPEDLRQEAEFIRSISMLEIVPGLAKEGAGKSELSTLSNLPYLLNDFPNYAPSANAKKVIRQLNAIIENPDKDNFSKAIDKEWETFAKEGYQSAEIAFGKDFKTEAMTDSAWRFTKRSFGKHPVLSTAAVVAGAYGAYKLFSWIFGSKKKEEGKADEKSEKKEKSFWGKAIPYMVGGGALFLLGRYFWDDIKKWFDTAGSASEAAKDAAKGDIGGAVLNGLKAAGVKFENLDPRPQDRQAAELVNGLLAHQPEEGKLQNISSNAISVYRKIKLGSLFSIIQIADAQALLGSLGTNEYAGGFLQAMHDHPELAKEIYTFHRIAHSIQDRHILKENISDDMTVEQVSELLIKNQEVIKPDFQKKALKGGEGKTDAENAADAAKKVGKETLAMTKEFVDAVGKRYGTLKRASDGKTLNEILAIHRSTLEKKDIGILDKGSEYYGIAKNIVEILSENKKNVVLLAGEVMVIDGGTIVLKQSAAALYEPLLALGHEWGSGNVGLGNIGTMASVYWTNAGPLVAFGVLGGAAKGAIKSVLGLGTKQGIVFEAIEGGMKMGVLPLKLGKAATVDAYYTWKHFKEYSDLVWEEARLAKEWALTTAKKAIPFTDQTAMEEAYRMKRLLLLNRKMTYLEEMKNTKIFKTPLLESKAIEHEIKNLVERIENMGPRLKGGAAETIKEINEKIKDFSVAKRITDRPRLLKAIAESEELKNLFLPGKKNIFRGELLGEEFMAKIDSLIKGGSKLDAEDFVEKIMEEVGRYVPSDAARAISVSVEPGKAASEPTANPDLVSSEPLNIGKGKYRYKGGEFDLGSLQIEEEAKKLGKSVEETTKIMCEREWSTPKQIFNNAKETIFRYKGKELGFPTEQLDGKGPEEIAKLCEAKMPKPTVIAPVGVVEGPKGVSQIERATEFGTQFDELKGKIKNQNKLIQSQAEARKMSVADFLSKDPQGAELARQLENLESKAGQAKELSRVLGNAKSQYGKLLANQPELLAKLGENSPAARWMLREFLSLDKGLVESLAKAKPEEIIGSLERQVNLTDAILKQGKKVESAANGFAAAAKDAKMPWAKFLDTDAAKPLMETMGDADQTLGELQQSQKLLRSQGSPFGKLLRENSELLAKVMEDSKIRSQFFALDKRIVGQLTKNADEGREFAQALLSGDEAKFSGILEKIGGKLGIRNVLIAQAERVKNGMSYALDTVQGLPSSAKKLFRGTGESISQSWGKLIRNFDKAEGFKVELETLNSLAGNKNAAEIVEILKKQGLPTEKIEAKVLEEAAQRIAKAEDAGSIAKEIQELAKAAKVEALFSPKISRAMWALRGMWKGGGYALKGLGTLGLAFGAYETGSSFYEAATTNVEGRRGIMLEKGALYGIDTAVNTAWMFGPRILAALGISSVLPAAGSGFFAGAAPVAVPVLGTVTVSAAGAASFAMIPIAYMGTSAIESKLEATKTANEWASVEPTLLKHEWMTTTEDSISAGDRYRLLSSRKTIDEEHRNTRERMVEAILLQEDGEVNPDRLEFIKTRYKSAGYEKYDMNQLILTESRVYANMMANRRMVKGGGGTELLVGNLDLMEERFEKPGAAEMGFMIDAYGLNAIRAMDKQWKENFDRLSTGTLVDLAYQVRMMAMKKEGGVTESQLKFLVDAENYLKLKRNVILGEEFFLNPEEYMKAHQKGAILGEYAKRIEKKTEEMSQEKLTAILDHFDETVAKNDLEKEVAKVTDTPACYAIYKLAEFFGYSGHQEEGELKSFFTEANKNATAVYWDGEIWRINEAGWERDEKIGPELDEVAIGKLVKTFTENSDDVFGHRQESIVDLPSFGSIGSVSFGGSVVDLSNQARRCGMILEKALKDYPNLNKPKESSEGVA